MFWYIIKDCFKITKQIILFYNNYLIIYNKVCKNQQDEYSQPTIDYYPFISEKIGAVPAMSNWTLGGSRLFWDIRKVE